jgi:hypothetical protein
MGNTNNSIPKINFQDMQHVINNKDQYMLINTLPDTEQGCLIATTIHANQEENIINKYIKNTKNVKIIIYGKHSNDDTVYKKYSQLLGIGFIHIYIFTGGIWEWLLLQDIYGVDNFPTTSKQLDILKYKPNEILLTKMIGYE